MVTFKERNIFLMFRIVIVASVIVDVCVAYKEVFLMERWDFNSLTGCDQHNIDI